MQPLHRSEGPGYSGGACHPEGSSPTCCLEHEVGVGHEREVDAAHEHAAAHGAAQRAEGAAARHQRGGARLRSRTQGGRAPF